MKINLDPVFAAIATTAPDPIIITMGGVDYTVRELSVAEVLGLRTVGNDDAEGIAKIKALFAGDAPPVLDQLAAIPAIDLVARQSLLDQVGVILTAIQVAVREQSAKKYQMAATMIRSQADSATNSTLSAT